MPETRTVITVNGSPAVAAATSTASSRVHVEEALGAPGQGEHRRRDGHRQPQRLDQPARPAGRAGRAVHGHADPRRGTLRRSTRAASARAGTCVAGGLSTLTVEGMDRSVELDRERLQRLWHGHHRLRHRQHDVLGSTGWRPRSTRPPARHRLDTSTPRSRTRPTGRSCKDLAGRNGFDVRVETIDGTPPASSKGSTRTAAAADQHRPRLRRARRHGQRVGAAAGRPGGARDPHRPGHQRHRQRERPGHQATRWPRCHSGGATTLHANAAAGVSVVDAQTTATAMAERSAFGSQPDGHTDRPEHAAAPRAPNGHRRGVWASMLDGSWLVKSVRTDHPGRAHPGAGADPQRAGRGAGGAGGAASAAGARRHAGRVCRCDELAAGCSPATVTDNDDPEHKCRIKVKVPEVLRRRERLVPAVVALRRRRVRVRRGPAGRRAGMGPVAARRPDRHAGLVGRELLPAAPRSTAPGRTPSSC